MSVIEKKILPEYFEKVASGEKTFELRLADWECKTGDTLVLKEIDPVTKEPTGREIAKQVGFVLKTKGIELFGEADVEKHGYQVISLLPEENV